MAGGVRKLAANLAHPRRTAKCLGLGEVASSISRILQTVEEAKVAATAAHVATQTDSSVGVLRPDACVATQTEITPDASAAPTVTDMDYELEACEIASFMDEMVRDSAEGDDVDTAVRPTSPEPGLSTKGPAGPTGAKLQPEGGLSRVI